VMFELEWRVSRARVVYSGLAWPMPELVIDEIAELLVRCSRSFLRIL
jgi:hypothetical protein